MTRISYDAQGREIEAPVRVENARVRVEEAKKRAECASKGVKNCRWDSPSQALGLLWAKRRSGNESHNHRS